MENLNLAIILINGISGICFFVLVLISIIASFQAIKYNKGRAYSCIAISVFAFILVLAVYIIPSLNFLRIIFYTGMLISAILIWLTLRKSDKKNERLMSFLLIILVSIQFLFPIIAGFLTMLSNK